MDRMITRNIKGYVTIEVSGRLCERFLNLCAFHGIFLWSITPMEQVNENAIYRANLSIKDLKQLKGIRRKCHVKIRICHKYGLPFVLFRNRNRMIFLAGSACAVLFLFWMSGHIWKIQIDGNVSQTDDVILEYLETEQVVHGMKKSNIDCKNLAECIRSYFPGFSWVSVKLKGTCLMIEVNETYRLYEREPGLKESSIVSEVSGEVLSIYVRNGTSCVEVGDLVEPGTILVSGLVPVTDDSNTVVSWQHTAADADICIGYSLYYEDTISRKKVIKCYSGNEIKRSGIQVCDTVFALSHSFTDKESYDIVTKLEQWKIQKDFYLPIYWRTYLFRPYEKVQVKLSVQEIEANLTSNLEYFMKKLEEKGVQIFENDVKIEWNEMSVTASGQIYVGDPNYKLVATGHAEEELLKNEYG